jgi:membrane carboxypeptidase/penicillin-binding protein
MFRTPLEEKKYLEICAFRLFGTSLSHVIILILLLSVADVIAAETIVTHPVLPAGYRSIKVFDRHGHFAGRILPEKRYWVTLDRIPVFLRNALVAVEDARFYEHSGIVIRGIARAMVKNVVKGRMAEGGSTINPAADQEQVSDSGKIPGQEDQGSRDGPRLRETLFQEADLEMYLNEIYTAMVLGGLPRPLAFTSTSIPKN